MPTDIHTILLLPRDHAMLADGPGGSRAPTMPGVRSPRHPCEARCWRVGGPVVIGDDGRCPECGRSWPLLDALLLAHDGKVVEQARGWLPVDSQLLNDVLWVLHKPRNPETVWRTPELALDILRANTQHGTIILLDKSGMEVTP